MQKWVKQNLDEIEHRNGNNSGAEGVIEKTIAGNITIVISHDFIVTDSKLTNRWLRHSADVIVNVATAFQVRLLGNDQLTSAFRRRSARAIVIT